MRIIGHFGIDRTRDRWISEIPGYDMARHASTITTRMADESRATNGEPDSTVDNLAQPIVVNGNTSNSDIIVCKFGGSSITSKKDIERIGHIVRDDCKRKIVVVSAPGRQNECDAKVTDLLIRLAAKKDRSLIDRIIEKYRSLDPNGPLDAIINLITQNFSSGLRGEARMDAFKAVGEEACARLFANATGFAYVDPRELLLVSSDYGNARILPQSQEMVCKAFANRSDICVVPGFYGYNAEGKIATFSRGGSDLTGAYIAGALGAEVYENFTDADGVYAASPTIVLQPKRIGTMTFDELRDLAYSGFNVFHDEAIRPVRRRRVAVHIRNTFEYPASGTYIVHDRKSDPSKPIIGVAYRGGLCSFDIAIDNFNSMVGVGDTILRVLAAEGLSVEFITTGIDDLAVIIREDQINDRPEAIDNLQRSLCKSIIDVASRNSMYLQEHDISIIYQSHLGSLVLAGKDIKGRRGIAAHVQLALAEAGVDVRFMSQGPTERCIIYGVDVSDGDKAVRVVYEKFIK